MEHNVRFPDGDKIKTHFRKNKDKYLFFSLGAVVVLAIRKPITISPVFNNVPIFNNENITQFGGHAHKIVKCLETGDVWETVTDSAQAMNAPVSLMSRHLNGHKPNVYGKHFQIIGLGTR